VTRWPQYAAHCEARCFRCDGYLINPSDAGHATGQGRYVAQCDLCRLITHYDLLTHIDVKRNEAPNHNRPPLTYGLKSAYGHFISGDRINKRNCK
jgi:hypothetical protein